MQRKKKIAIFKVQEDLNLIGKETTAKKERDREMLNKRERHAVEKRET